MVSFLITEREQAGWRFLLLWIIASNVGFFIGIGLEMLLFGRVNLYFAVPLAGVGQAYVINRHISIYLPWAVGSAIFWLIGIAIGIQIFKLMMTPDTLITQIIFLIAVSLIGGLFAGIPQWLFMRDWLPVGIGWFPVSAIGHALLISGLVTGIILMNLITRDKIPMKERHYELSGEY